jgi:hypothetical protein
VSRRSYLPSSAAVLLLAGLAGGALVKAIDRPPDENARVTSSGTATSSQPKPYVVSVTLDRSGRPYDVTLPKGATVVHRPMTVLHAPSGRVLFMGGEAVPYAKADEYEAVTLAERPGRRYPVEAIWEDVKHGYDSIVGVVILERDTPIVRWRELQRVAYGTDGGVGGITTVEWAERPKALVNELSRLWDEQLIEKERQWFAADVDGHEGVDAIVFQNGFGDGGFPSIAGYDASGARAAIVLWTIVVPWRLAFPEGQPPAQVTSRERALAACLAGRRTVELGAHCRLAR